MADVSQTLKAEKGGDIYHSEWRGNRFTEMRHGHFGTMNVFTATSVLFLFLNMYLLTNAHFF